MAYLGNAPARSFISFERQVFTIVNSQTAYTLSHSVTNENDIRLVVNNVVQEPGSGKAYTASGTTLTLSAALTNGTDEMYCVFLGRAVGTVNAPAGSVTATQLVYPLTTFSSTGIDDNADATAMTIDSSEKVGIGETAPLGKLHVKSGDSGVSSPDITDLVVECSGNGGMSLLGATNGQVEIAFGDSGDANIGRIAYNNNGNYLATVVNASEVIRTHSNGVTAFNNGIALGVGTANTASNVLDDYEEGTWTPLVDGASLGAVGYYKKIGKICLVHFGNQTGAALALNNGDDYDISGLPFNMMNDGGDAWKYGSVPSASFADATASYYSQPLTGRQNNSGAIHIMNRSGVNVSSSDPVNVSMVYSTT